MTSSGAQSQHNLVHSQVNKTTQQLDDLCIVDEQDIGTSDTASSEESDHAGVIDSGDGAEVDKHLESSEGADEEEGAAGVLVTTPRRERSFGESIFSYFSSLCSKQTAVKVPEAQGTTSGPCGPQDEAAHDGLWEQLVLSSLDPMDEQDASPPQDFLAETQDILVEDVVTQSILNQVLTQSTAEVQDDDMLMPHDLLNTQGGDSGAGYPQFRDQAAHAGGEYVLQVRQHIIACQCW